MVNIAGLKEIIRKNGLSIKELSQLLKIDPSTFYRKMQSRGDSFTVKEATEISLQLKLTAEQVQNIFFAS